MATGDWEVISNEQKLEMVVYIARKTGWSREDIGKMTPLQFVQIYNELAFQESLDTWRQQHNLATILAAIYNTISRGRGARTLEAKDFYDVPQPTRGGQDRKVMAEVDKQAIEAGITLPKE